MPNMPKLTKKDKVRRVAEVLRLYATSSVLCVSSFYKMRCCQVVA